jgi:diguanylate cyclase (GGDEF)-like protein
MQLPTAPDVATASLMLAIAMGMIAVAMMLISRSSQLGPSIRPFAASCLLLALGFATRAMSDPDEPGPLHAAGNALAVLAVALQIAALIEHLRSSRRGLLRIGLGLALAHALTMAAFAGGIAGPRALSVGSAAFGALLQSLGAALMLAPARPELRRVHRVIAGIFAIGAAFLAVRVVRILLLDVPPATDAAAAWAYVVGASAQIVMPLAFVTLLHLDLSSRLARSALLDPLTGLLNRRGLDQAWDQIVALARRGGPARVAVLMLDVDHFKRINDSFGHGTGDRVIECLASAITHATRGIDSTARVGGEEFCVLLPGTDQSQALQVAERIREAFAAMAADVASTPVTLSAGVAVADPRRTPLGLAVDAADRMLYLAKHAGRDRTRVRMDLLGPEPDAG